MPFNYGIGGGRTSLAAMLLSSRSRSLSLSPHYDDSIFDMYFYFNSPSRGVESIICFSALWRGGDGRGGGYQSIWPR